jgi:TPR repeat protein
LYRLAADQRYAMAQTNLATCFRFGAGTACDEREAARLYRDAAVQGHAWSMNRIGDCYKDKIGVERNKLMAACFYRLSAELGNDYGIRLSSEIARKMTRV